MNNQLDQVLNLVDEALDNFFTLEEAIDWALERLPVCTREQVVAAVIDDTKDTYRFSENWD